MLKEQHFAIPCIPQGENECGPICIQMVSYFFGVKAQLYQIKALVSSESSGTTWAIGLVKAAAYLGFQVTYYTTFLGVNPQNFELLYYLSQTDGYDNSRKIVDPLIAEMKKNSMVTLEVKSLSLDNILERLSPSTVVICEINWGDIIRSQNYIGHFVVITGYDKKYIYVHQTLENPPIPDLAIPKKIFEKARKQLGTDENLIFITT